MKLLVLDGNSLVNRAYFGIKLLTTKDGRYTNAIFGFQNILLNLLSAHTRTLWPLPGTKSPHLPPYRL